MLILQEVGRLYMRHPIGNALLSTIWLRLETSVRLKAKLSNQPQRCAKIKGQPVAPSLLSAHKKNTRRLANSNPGGPWAPLNGKHVAPVLPSDRSFRVHPVERSRLKDSFAHQSFVLLDHSQSDVIVGNVAELT